MSLQLVEEGDIDFDKTFILYNRFININGIYDQISKKYYVTIRKLMEDGSETNVTKRWKREKVNNFIKRKTNADTRKNSILAPFKMIDANPDNFFYYTASTMDRMPLRR